MNSAREDKLERLFEGASALPAERRAAFVDEACGADEELRATLAALMADAAEAFDFGDLVIAPAVARVSGILLGDLHPVGDDDRTDSLLGHHVAHFQIVEKLGGGGMGRVYKAVDVRLDRTVALKFLPPHLDTDDEAKRRFALEARAASVLDHPNICAIHEIGETADGHLFIVNSCCFSGFLTTRTPWIS